MTIPEIKKTEKNAYGGNPDAVERVAREETGHTPECDNEDCACNGKMELNGLRFTCDHGCTLECHIDDFPIYDAAPALLKALQQFAGCNLTEDNCASLEVANRRIRNIAHAAIAKAEGMAQ